jgi:hypothetical protein
MTPAPNTPNRIHVAVLKKKYLDLILSGRKRMECRLTKIACPPYGAIASGERILLKESSGPVRGESLAGPVIFMGRLTPQDVDDLCQKYNEHILGDDEFWNAKRICRYVTLIPLQRVMTVTPYRLKTSGMCAWRICTPRQLKSILIKTPD